MPTTINPKRQIKPASIPPELLTAEAQAQLFTQLVPQATEVLGGAIDGLNQVFFIPADYKAVSIYLNGQRLEELRDFTVDSNNPLKITTTFLPEGEDRLTCFRFSLENTSPAPATSTEGAMMRAVEDLSLENLMALGEQ